MLAVRWSPRYEHILASARYALLTTSISESFDIYIFFQPAKLKHLVKDNATISLTDKCCGSPVSLTYGGDSSHLVYATLDLLINQVGVMCCSPGGLIVILKTTGTEAHRELNLILLWPSVSFPSELT